MSQGAPAKPTAIRLLGLIVWDVLAYGLASIAASAPIVLYELAGGDNLSGLAMALFVGGAVTFLYSLPAALPIITYAEWRRLHALLFYVVGGAVAAGSAVIVVKLISGGSLSFSSGVEIIIGGMIGGFAFWLVRGRYIGGPRSQPGPRVAAGSASEEKISP